LNRFCKISRRSGDSPISARSAINFWTLFLNFFVKPNEQCQACLSIAMVRKSRMKFNNFHAKRAEELVRRPAHAPDFSAQRAPHPHMKISAHYDNFFQEEVINE